MFLCSTLHLRARQRLSYVLKPSLTQQIRSLFIQTEDTPNDHALKFLSSMNILSEGQTMEFLSGKEAFSSPLAKKLFAVDGVKSVMFGENFITIEKKDQSNWMLIKPEIFSILTESLTSGEALFDKNLKLSKDTDFDEDDDDVVSMIKELIDTRIRPATQEDGGDIEFVDFEEDSGTVVLKLMGACRSCDSSSITLKNGIESMLKHYIEEVKDVRQLEHDEKEVMGDDDPLLALKNKEADIPPSL